MEQISPRAAHQWNAGEPETVVAAVDLGSNSFHLLIAREANGRFEVEEHLKEATRVGAELDSDGAIGAAAMARGFACLDRFGERLSRSRPTTVRAVGTNALRVASNAAEFLAGAEARLGCRVETISGIEEARLIYLGVCGGLSAATRRLVADIGGGSTELIVGEGANALRLESLPFGCVGLTQQFFPGGRLDARAMQHAEVAARRELEPVAREYRDLGWVEAVGASGTVHAIAAIARAGGWSDGAITPAVLDRLTAALTAGGDLERLRLAGLEEDQRPVLPGGVAIMRALFAGLGINRLRLVEGALREGLLYESFARLNDADVRSASVRDLAARCRVDIAHASRVDATAQMLLHEVATAWSLDQPDDARWLSWAAQLHECGRAIACNGFHRHGAYIVENADLAGCSQQDQRNVATLIRAHRRVLPLAVFQQHREPLRNRLFRLALLLRLGALLCRSRADLHHAGIRLTGGDKAATLHFPAGWLDVRALTAADLEEEAAYWQAAGWTLTYN
ncbi:MAG TPA: Ppx/GppA phosphatase family protein [Gammaproteobacteria bacterium]|nr:Ppx/GppA phosphatase family protein [Gammaproteobacteria bacterium]